MDASFELAREYNNDIMFVKTDGGDVTPHFHQHLELYYVLSGETRITINKEMRILKKNQLSITGFYDVHIYERIKSGYAYILLIPPAYLSEYSKYMQDKKLSSNFITDEYTAKNILDSIKMLSANLHSNSLLISGIFNTMLGLIIENCVPKENDSPLNFELMKDVMDFIEKNFTSEITLDRLADKFNYSKFHFSKLFNNYFACNLSEVLNILRARNAALLIDSGYPLSQAVFNSGFSSMRTFYRVFKKVYGKTYTEYIKK